MPLKYLDKLFERLETARQDSDTALFYDLLFVGEAITKLVVAGLVAAVADDPQRSRYRQLHKLVRADGLGEWTMVLDELLTGPTAQHMKQEASQETRELTQACSPGEWQYDAVAYPQAISYRTPGSGGHHQRSPASRRTAGRGGAPAFAVCAAKHLGLRDGCCGTAIGEGSMQTWEADTPPTRVAVMRAGPSARESGRHRDVEDHTAAISRAGPAVGCLMNARRSALMVSASVVGIPCGKPL